MDNNALIKWMHDNNIIERTFQYFWEAFNNYKNKLSKEKFELYFNDYDEKEIKLRFRSISQRVVFLEYLQNDNSNVNIIEARVLIEYNDDTTYGEYSAFYDFSGNVIDDTLGSNWEKWYVNLRKEVFGEVTKEFADLAFSEGIDPKLVTKVVNNVFKNL